MSATATRNVKIGSPPSDLRMLLAAQVVSCKQNKTMDQLQGGFDRSTSDSDIESLLLLSTKKKQLPSPSTDPPSNICRKAHASRSSGTVAPSYRKG